jgi:hypothetical protein
MTTRLATITWEYDSEGRAIEEDEAEILAGHLPPGPIVNVQVEEVQVRGIALA